MALESKDEQIPITWTIKHFRDLTLEELYAILRLRSEVFVVEQNCVFLDIDNNDQTQLHVMGWALLPPTSTSSSASASSESASSDSLTDKQPIRTLVATTRLFSLTHSPYPTYTCIGRVCVSLSVRRHGVGKELMKRSIQAVEENYGKGPIKIGAQMYLKNFYGSFGFYQVGEPYDEDGIMHIYMIRD